jgi:hypothetical protein
MRDVSSMVPHHDKKLSYGTQAKLELLTDRPSTAKRSRPAAHHSKKGIIIFNLARSIGWNY